MNCADCGQPIAHRDGHWTHIQPHDARPEADPLRDAIRLLDEALEIPGWRERRSA